MSVTPKKIVIIGGGFAGLACARGLANNDHFEVTLLDKQNHHLFQPLLYQVASATLSAPDIARSLRGILSRCPNITIFLDHILQIDEAEKTVTGRERSYQYDYLVIAAGMKTSWFGNHEWKKHTVGLKTLNDAHRIRERILSSFEKAEIICDPKEQQRLMTVVIVGGGPTGVELAGAFEDLVQLALHSDFRRIDPSNLRTILVQSGDRILKAFPPEQSEYARQKLEKSGVEVLLNNRVTGVEEGVVELKSGDRIEAETIIWAAGVGASRVSEHVNCTRDRAGRLYVQPDLSLPNHPEIFAAGDIVNLADDNGVSVPGLAPAAVQMGEHVAKVIKEDLRLKTTRFAHKQWKLRPRYRYLDKGIMAIIGKQAAVVSVKKIRLKGTLAWLSWLFIHVLFLVGFRNKIVVLTQWAFAYFAQKPGSRVFSTGERAPDILEEPQ